VSACDTPDLPVAYGVGEQAQLLRGDSCASLMQLAVIGAVVGGSAAAGANLRRLQNDTLTLGEALADVGRAAAVGGAATAVAGAVAGAVASQGAVRLAVLFAAGTAVMYGLQSHLEQE
jgi:hypothetical protein